MRKLPLAIVLMGGLFIAARADAYLCTAVPNSSPVLSQAWNQRCIPYFISTSGALLDGEARRMLILQSFNVWSTPNCTDINFMDFGYTDQAPGFDQDADDNQNIVVSIESESQARDIFTRSELAITITSFNTATGEIFDADIMINAVTYPFEDVADTASCRMGDEPLPYDLRNTLVHEIGHFIGFEHDADPDSTMYASAPECETKKRDLTTDNTLGVCTVYGIGQPTMTCAPPSTYERGGDVSQFRNQCDLAAIKHGCGCTTTEPSDVSSLSGLLLLAAVIYRRKRRPLSSRLSTRLSTIGK